MRIGAKLLFALAAVAAAGTMTRADEVLTYNVTLNPDVDGVSNIILMNQTAGGQGSSWPHSLPAGSGSITLDWPTSPPASFSPIVSTVGIGLATGVAGDSGPTLAIFGDYTAAQLGESFSTLFPGVSESNLISDLENLSGADCILSAGALCTKTIASDAVPFYDEAKADGLFIPGGADFDVVAYTDGQIIGTGSLAITNTPEPSSFLLLGFGLLALVAAKFALKERNTTAA